MYTQYTIHNALPWCHSLLTPNTTERANGTTTEHLPLCMHLNKWCRWLSAYLTESFRHTKRHYYFVNEKAIGTKYCSSALLRVQNCDRRNYVFLRGENFSMRHLLFSLYSLLLLRFWLFSWNFLLYSVEAPYSLLSSTLFIVADDGAAPAVNGVRIV